jgi:hypothetical protein
LCPVGWYNLCQTRCSNNSFGANDPRRGVTSIYMELFGLLGTTILSTLHPWWSSWISDQENATILHDQNRISNCQHLLVDVDVHTTYISNLSNFNHTAPSICSEYMNIEQSNISQFTCRLCLAHTDITTSAYTYGHGNPEGISIRHSLHTSDHPKRIFHSPYAVHFFRRIPGIRGRFIPHIECQESWVNVTSWYSPSFISMYKKNLD